MRYASEIEMDNKIERIVKAKVKYYYTDWKNYDRPKYMGIKGSKARQMILIVRTCGTYLFTTEELKDYDFAKTVYEYYMDYESADYYYIDLDKREVVRHNADMRWLREVA